MSKVKGKSRTYKKKDFSSGDGMMTAIWGPNMWHYLHTISFNYPVSPSDDDKKHYKEFILNMQFTLPCKYCRMNLVKNFKVHPLRPDDMKDRDSFSRYIYKLHEIVNKMLKKKSGLSYFDVRERYENFRSRCTQDDKSKLFSFDKIESQTNTTKKKKSDKKKEKGCTEPLYGKKAKCVINIVPQETKCKTLQIDKSCLKTRV